MATSTVGPPLRLGVVGSGFAARTVAAAAGRCPDITVAGVTGGGRAAE